MNIPKIYINCKRGMLELDIILLTFLEHYYNKLSKKEKSEFELMLEESDEMLYEMIIKNKINHKYKNIIKKIQKCHNKFKFK